MIEELKHITENKFSFFEKNDDYVQIILPIYAEDGDLYEIFVKKITDRVYRITDCGLTIMRLSYSYEIDTDKKRELLNKIILANRVEMIDGEIFIETNTENFENSAFRLAQVIAKVSNMYIYSREVVRSLFFEELEEFVYSKLEKYHPQKEYYPIPENPEYQVDYCFNGRVRPIYLFGVNTSDKAKIATISCQQFLLRKMNFKSLIIFEDLDKIKKKDRDRLLNVSDKTITNFDFYKENIIEFFERESA